MTRRANATPDPIQTLTQLVETLQDQLATLHHTQQKTLKALVDQQQVISHRVSVMRDQLGALIKASHTELLEHIIALSDAVQDQHDRLNTLERDFDSVFDAPLSDEDPNGGDDDGSGA